MGRVARYKKVKAFDPFSKKNEGGRGIDLSTVGIWGLGEDGRKPKKRSLTAEKLRAKKKLRKGNTKQGVESGYDVPPDGKDEFDMADLVGSIKKEKIVLDEPRQPFASKPVMPAVTKRSNEQAVSIPDKIQEVSTPPTKNARDDDLRQAKLLKIDKQIEDSKKSNPLVAAEGRMKGEGKNAYRKRVRDETRQLIYEEKQSTRNQEKVLKKKEFLKNKKKKKKGGTPANARFLSNADSDGNESVDDGLVTGERAIAVRDTEVKFGEQAERPPSFKHVPRGATPKAEPGQKRVHGMKDEEVQAEMEAMERIRRTVNARYAAIKSKRKHEGDFHL